MQNPPLVHADDGLAGERNSDKRRIGVEIRGESFPICRFDFRIVDEAGERLADGRVAASGRRPGDLFGFAPGLHDLVGK